MPQGAGMLVTAANQGVKLFQPPTYLLTYKKISGVLAVGFTKINNDFHTV